MTPHAVIKQVRSWAKEQKDFYKENKDTKSAAVITELQSFLRTLSRRVPKAKVVAPTAESEE